MTKTTTRPKDKSTLRFWIFPVSFYRWPLFWGIYLSASLSLVVTFLCWFSVTLTAVTLTFVTAGLLAAYLIGVLYFQLVPGLTALWLTLTVFLVTLSVLSAGPSTTEYLTVDSVNGPFLFLTVSLFPMVVMASLESVHKNQFWYYLLLLLLLSGLLFCFSCTSFLAFYLVFEVLGFPMFALIGMYGPRDQRIKAAYKFFVYTFLSSGFMLPVLVYFSFYLQTSHLHQLLLYQFTQEEQILFFGLTSVPFLIKVPLVPFHLWLPEAHVEAPTPVSMLLAGLLLKTGGYAFLRFLLPLFPYGNYVWGPFLIALGVVSVVLSSLYAVVQVDLKRMVAYASIAHMSVVLVGLLSNQLLGLQGATYLMLSHGYTSAGLFAGIGVLYDRYHTRTIRYYGGLNQVMPVFGLLFFLLTLSNISFPLTGGFVGEFLILFSVSQHNLLVVTFLGSTVLLSLVYSLWLYNRLFYGPMGAVNRFQDLTYYERLVLSYLTFFSLGLGFTGVFFNEYTRACYLLVIETGLPG